jgi:hypothetical protein
VHPDAETLRLFPEAVHELHRIEDAAAPHLHSSQVER